MKKFTDRTSETISLQADEQTKSPKSEDNEKVQIRAIYDRMFKRIMSLSSKAVINFINGLYGTEYSADSDVTYVSTEGIKSDLTATMSDVMITINHQHTYHMEAQMEKDETIVFRVFEYGYMRAEHSKMGNVLTFPQPKIIYLYSENGIPEEYVLTLDFQGQGIFEYKVSTYNFIKATIQELNEKKMILLIPFELLKLRKELENNRNVDNMERLKKLLVYDIIGTIDRNLKLGNIEMSDANQLKNLTVRLYRHLYANYEEMKVAGVNDMVDDVLELEIDKVIEEYEAKLEIKLEENTEQVTDRIAAANIERMLKLGKEHKDIAECLDVPEELIIDVERKMNRI